jgi:hypothetical protein
MKKVIKLTETDLYRIVKRVISEQSSNLEAKLRDNGFTEARNTRGKKVLAKRIENVGDFFFEFVGSNVKINVLNPISSVIVKMNLEKIGKNKRGDWFTKGETPEIEAERILDFIMKSFATSNSTENMSNQKDNLDEERFDFENMSDEELHDLHPHIKRHPRHFKDFSPTSEYLGWRGEVDKRNIYKRHGKFHDAFDNEKED